MRFLTHTAAALLATTFGIGAALAQQQLAEEVFDQLTRIGIPTQGLVLTEGQVLQLESILNDNGLSQHDRAAHIRMVIGE